MALRRICVYMGSSPGNDPAYRADAERLATVMVQRGIGLVYGGANIGLMGATADAVLEAGGEVIGVTPDQLVQREKAHTGLTELRVVGSMHERKALMAELADAFIALPGGLGTLEELLEAATWNQLGLHAKPCSVLDTGGYYQGLVAFLDHAVAAGFLRSENRDLILVDDDPARLIDRLAAWQPPGPGVWATPPAP